MHQLQNPNECGANLGGFAYTLNPNQHIVRLVAVVTATLTINRRQPTVGLAISVIVTSKNSKVTLMTAVVMMMQTTMTYM